MSTLIFDENVVPIARHLAETKYGFNERELSSYIAGFVEGWSARAGNADARAQELRERAEHWRDVSETLWRGAIEALLVLEPTHPAKLALHNALASSQLRRS